MSSPTDRIAVVESEVENLKKSISKVEEISYEVKERLDQQNGILPRLEKALVIIDHKLNAFDERIDSSEAKVKSTDFKVKILWGIATTIGGVLLLGALKFLFDGLFP